MRLEIANDAVSGVPNVFIYDIIGDYAPDTNEWLTAKAFIERCSDFKGADLINLRINSAGGEVFDATAIYNWLIAQDFEINVYIDGLAASAASLIAMAGDKIFMPRNALMMVHNPSTYMSGDAGMLKTAAETLDKVTEGMAEIYAAKTGLDKAKIVELMAAETWLNAEEAKELGFCTDIIEPAAIKACALDEDKFALKDVLMGGAAIVKDRYKNLLMRRGVISEVEPVDPDVQDMESFKAILRKIDPKAFNAAKADSQDTEQIFNSGIEAERKRLKELDDLAVIAPGCEAMIARAKYETFKNASDIALEVLRSFKELKAREQDAEAINGVLGVSEFKETDRTESLIAAAVKNINDLRGV